MAWFDSAGSLVLASESPDWPALADSWWQLLSGALRRQAQNCQSEGAKTNSAHTQHTHTHTHTHTHIEFHQESEKVNRKRTAQQSRKMKRWKSLLSEIRGDGCKEKWKYKGVQAWRDRTGWKVNNTGRTFEALILRSEKVTTLVQSDFYFLWSVSNNNTIIPLILH